MARPSDKEYKLFQKIRELEEQNRKKDLEIQQLKKKIDKLDNKEERQSKVKTVEKGCPNCSATIKSTKLPFGTLHICSAACGFRRVEND